MSRRESGKSDMSDDYQVEAELILPKTVEKRVNALYNLHKKYIQENAKFQKEVRELERKYQKLYEPIFAQRSKIVTGEYEPTDEEAHHEPDPAEEEDKKDKKDQPEGADIKGIPDFWSHALQNHDFITEAIFDNDQPALAHLRDITCETTDEMGGYKLSFHFAPNEFFTNTVLTKQYFMEVDELTGEMTYSHAEGCTIDWNNGKDLTYKTVKKKQASKNKKQPAKTITVREPQNTFFSFFSPPAPPKEDDEDEEEADMQAEILEADFEVGNTIKERVIPNAILYFTGEMDDDIDADFGDDEDGEDDDEDDEDEEEEEEEAPRKKGRGGRGGARGGPGHAFAPPAGAQGPAQPQQPECKQQ